MRNNPTTTRLPSDYAPPVERETAQTVVPTLSWRGAFLSSVVGSIVTFLFALGTGAWSSKESVQAHNADISAMEVRLMESIHDTNATVERILDGMCEAQPRLRICAPSSMARGGK